MAFLPVCKADVDARGWDRVDFVLVSGDAYVDHPSFGPAIISRVLESRGFRVAILAQPDWRNISVFKEYGRPRLGFLVAAGNIDSMVNHYTASKRKRSTDAYSPGGKMGLRPNRATIVYCNCIRQAYKNMPIAVGGVEVSLRRFAHYDYWDDQVRASILYDSGADLLLYGMGEHSIVELAEGLAAGLPIAELTYIQGSSYFTDSLEKVYDYQLIESYEEVKADKNAYCNAFMAQYKEQNPIKGKRLVQPHGKGFVVVNPPALPLTGPEMDEVYGLPYERTFHPMYTEAGGVPAIDEVEFSITANRGCFGACSFCALTFHQGRMITSRSPRSIMSEAQLITQRAGFKGYIHDVGGPTANFYAQGCEKAKRDGPCKDRQCMFPTPCPNINPDHTKYMELLRQLRTIPKVKKVFVRSGIRFDFLVADKKHGKAFMDELCMHHVSGQLKVAPEHISDGVLRLMGKPQNQVYNQFAKEFEQTNARIGKEQYLVPYLISSHPGSDLNAAIALAEYLRDYHLHPEQVQDFYPTPGTLSTCMYYTGMDPRTMRPVFVPKDPKEKAMQRALLQYSRPENYELVRTALLRAGRGDLIGFSPKCLIRPREVRRDFQRQQGSNTKRATNQPRKFR